jgi:hypothetical protein
MFYVVRPSIYVIYQSFMFIGQFLEFVAGKAHFIEIFS